MQKRNYKVYADIGLDKELLTRRLTVLDTGAGPNFIRMPELGPTNQERTRYGPLQDIRDANRNAVRTLGAVKLPVRIGHYLVKVKFVVCRSLAAPIVLGCDYCDRFVEAIRPRSRLITLDDGSTVPIVRRPLRKVPTAAPLPPSMEYELAHGLPSPKIRESKPSVLTAESQTWVKVITQPHGLVVIQANAVITFTDNDYHLSKNHIVVAALPHPIEVVPSHVSPAEVLEFSDVSDESTGAYEGPREEPQPTEEQNDREKLVEELVFGKVPEGYKESIKQMLKKYASMWTGKLGGISATENHIDVIPGSRPISQPPHRAGPRTRQIEEDNVAKMLEAGVIETAQSAWASPVVLVPNPDGSLRFCVYYQKLNPVTLRDIDPLTRMDECIDSLGNANVFITLDANTGYWQVPVSEKDQD
ncbi:unnamed protein product [Agarophyton chilense]